MIRRSHLSMFALVTGCVLTIVGCPQVIRIPVEFDLSGGSGTFNLVAGQMAKSSGTGALGSDAVSVGSGTMRIKPENVSFTPAGPAKGLINMQAGGTITVTASIAGADAVDTVCDSPVDSYGPFTVTLDESFNVASITPDSVALTQGTIDILNSGSFSFCLTADSATLSGTLTIGALSFVVGL